MIFLFILFAIFLTSFADLDSIHPSPSRVDEPEGISSWSPQCPSSSGKIPRLIPHPHNCRSLFICTSGQSKEYFCPKGEVFSAEQQECKKGDKCRKENSKELPGFESCPQDGRNHLFPHPTSCGMFYQCVHGVAFPRPCPRDLHFNPELEVCDWPYRANCKARFFMLKP